jgi:peptidoglycan/LPS O-acetylase OafA/YrhL
VPGYTSDLHPDFYTWPAIDKLFYFLLHGAHLQQLWFVPMISLFYLCAPLLIYIDRHPQLYFSLFAFIIVSLIIERDPLSDILKMFVHFFSVYLFGMFMSHYKNQYLEFAKKYWPLITAVTILVFILNLLFFEYNKSLNYLHKMLFCCFFIYWLWKLDTFIPNRLAYLADISFGVFFIHYYFILIYRGLYEKFAGHALPGNFINWVLVFVFTLGCSILLIELIRKVFSKNSRYIIGC